MMRAQLIPDAPESECISGQTLTICKSDPDAINQACTSDPQITHANLANNRAQRARDM